MLAAFRTYRFFSVALVLALLLSGSLPLIEHVCAMADNMGQTHHDCCCEGEPDTPMAGHHGHQGHMPEPADPMPCPEADMEQPCCTTEMHQADMLPAKPLEPTSKPERLGIASLTTTVVPLVATPRILVPGRHDARFSHPPVSLHLLNAVFQC